MAVHYSPATLQNVGFTIESKNQPSGAAVLIAQANGHKLTPTGVKAMLGQANTYISGLSAASLSLVAPFGSVQVGAGYVQIPCLQSDLSSLTSNVASVFTTSGYVVAS